MLREAGYKHPDAKADAALVKRMVKPGALKRARGGKVEGEKPRERVDRRARGGDIAFDQPDDADGNVHANSARARGGHVGSKAKPKVIVNVAQGDPEKEQMAHQTGMQQGLQLGARMAAQKMGGAGGAPRPPMAPPGPGMAAPGGAPGGLPGGVGMAPRPMPQGVPQRPGMGMPGAMARGGAMVRRHNDGRFAGGAV
jgi:hypothetical protein